MNSRSGLVKPFKIVELRNRKLFATAARDWWKKRWQNFFFVNEKTFKNKKATFYYIFYIIQNSLVFHFTKILSPSPSESALNLLRKCWEQILASHCICAKKDDYFCKLEINHIFIKCLCVLLREFPARARTLISTMIAPATHLLYQILSTQFRVGWEWDPLLNYFHMHVNCTLSDIYFCSSASLSLTTYINRSPCSNIALNDSW